MVSFNRHDIKNEEHRAPATNTTPKTLFFLYRGETISDPQTSPLFLLWTRIVVLINQWLSWYLHSIGSSKTSGLIWFAICITPCPPTMTAIANSTPTHFLYYIRLDSFSFLVTKLFNTIGDIFGLMWGCFRPSASVSELYQLINDSILVLIVIWWSCL